MIKIHKIFNDRKIVKIKKLLDEQDFLNYSILFPFRTDGHMGYRIPAIICLPNNIICTFAEGRINSNSDYAHMNLVMKRSEDGGKTWSDLQILMRNEDKLQLHNPCPVFDKDTQELLLLVVKNRTIPYILKSKDYGKTWTKPAVIENINPHGWTFNGPSPGHGIQLESGRILITGMYSTNEQNSIWGSYYFYSDDHGKTWELGHVFDLLINESQSAKLGGNKVFTIARAEKPEKNTKLIAYSDDGGKTATELVYSSDLVGPVCQSAIIEYGADKLIFSGPIGDARSNMTIKVSDDGGKTFPITKLIYGKYSSYSDLAVMEDGTICLLFECGIDRMSALAFIHFKL
jgi:sialidase-1